MTLTATELVLDVPGRVNNQPLSFTLQAGEVWGVLGPNGAGKTTLLHTLAGLRRPRQGQVNLDGVDLKQLRRRKIAQQLAVIFQDQHEGLPGTVLETALSGRHPFLSPWDVETAEDMALAEAALQHMELSALQQRHVSTLSGGERQRLAIATALCQTPQVLLADEPSNHLDLHHQVRVMQLFRQQAQHGCALLLCLHDLNLAARYCDKLLLLYPDGQACWGDTGSMLNLPALEALYQQTLQVVDYQGIKVFVPVAAPVPKPSPQGQNRT